MTTAYITNLMSFTLTLHNIRGDFDCFLRIHETTKTNDRLAFGQLDEFNVGDYDDFAACCFAEFDGSDVLALSLLSLTMIWLLCMGYVLSLVEVWNGRLEGGTWNAGQWI
jgi:hypothetical protein